MKLKTKKARCIITRQNNSSDIAQNILHEYSENSQNRIFSKSFAYGLMVPVNHESSSLSYWAENQLSLDPKSPLKKSMIQVALPKQTQRMKQRYKTNLHIEQSSSFRRPDNKQKRGNIYVRSNRERANTTRKRCIVNVVSPKFDEQMLQGKMQFIKSHSSGLYTQMRETMRQRKSAVVKRVQKGSIQDHSKSEEDHSIDASKQKQKTKNYKLYSEIQIKFNDSSIDYSNNPNNNANKQPNSLRISRLLAYKNSNTTRGKNTIKKQRINEQVYKKIGQFQSLKSVITLRSLINRQKFQKISVKRNIYYQ